MSSHGPSKKAPMPFQPTNHPMNESKPENRVPIPSQKGAPKPRFYNK